MNGPSNGVSGDCSHHFSLLKPGIMPEIERLFPSLRGSFKFQTPLLRVATNSELPQNVMPVPAQVPPPAQLPRDAPHVSNNGQDFSHATQPASPIHELDRELYRWTCHPAYDGIRPMVKPILAFSRPAFPLSGQVPRRIFPACGGQTIARRRTADAGRKVRTPQGSMPRKTRGRPRPKPRTTESVTENQTACRRACRDGRQG